MSDIIPIFYSDSSGKAINTWAPEKECKPDGPQSIISLAKKAGLKQVYFVSTRMYDFISAWRLCNENDLQLIFGLELWVCANPEERSDDSVADESKVIVWMRNSNGYRDIIKLYSKIFTNPAHKYYKFRGPWKILKECWTDNLVLTISYFDSFLHRNTLNYGSSIIPDFPCKPVFMKEINSGLPFAPLIDEALENFTKNGDYEVIKTKTIYYPDYEDAKAWVVYRAIKNGTTFHEPELEHSGSRNFCLTNYLELVKKES
jgi:DNA polymerase III alpha subunit